MDTLLLAVLVALLCLRTSALRPAAAAAARRSVLSRPSAGDVLGPFAGPRPRLQRLLSSVATTPVVVEEEERVIVITDKAMKHLEFMRSKQAEAVTLRMGVRAGGCSGMSYVMDFIKESDVLADDHVEEYGGIKCVVDPKSLLFLYGLQLDYSDELIGGGFKFANPNAGTSCGCGKSFGV